MLTTLCWGGIGDTLRNIALIPHAALHKATGLRTRVVYKGWRETGCLSHALPPEPEFFESLISRVPSLEWRGESGEHRGVARLLNRGLRDLLRAFNHGIPRYYPFELQLSLSERAALPEKPSGLVVGIQTHLHGMVTKRWGVNNWRAFLEKVIRAYPGIHLLLLDSAPEVEELRLNSRVTTTVGLNIAQSIALCRHLDLIVSIDSWTKYVGAWLGIPQVIVVPDQRSEYPALSPEKLVRDEFAGIYGQPQNTILGLEGSAKSPELLLQDIEDLSPGQLLTAIRTQLKRAA